MSITNRITELFEKKRDAKVLNIYVTAGYPGPDDTVQIVTDLDRAGADIVELGMPYSDPLADGATIQMSSARSLQQGITLEKIFSQVRQIRQQAQVPLVLMGYVNQMIQYGAERFIRTCAETGVDGLIIPDMPTEIFEGEYRDLLEKYNISFSFLVTPETADERMKKLDALSTGFLYVVSSSSVTGKSGGISDEQIAYFQRIERLNLTSPRLIGFGISDKESFDRAAAYADGAIIGSAFIRHLQEFGPGAAASFAEKIRPVQV
ncbi:MAG: tryptophan synthase subunit alpha [Fibrobacterota bacterium]